MEFRILGPLEVVHGNVSLPLGGPKHRALLALLVLNADQVVSNDQIVESLWGEDRPRTPSGSIQNSISHLRKLLGAERLITKAPGYVLRIGGEELDADRARTLLTEARSAGSEDRVELLRQAEALWRGAPLADFTYDAFAQAAIGQLEELRLSIQEERIGYELESGLSGELIAELEALVGEHPLRERPRGQLMLALYRSGRQADALHAYQEARRELLEQLGIDPGPALQQLHNAILRQERSLDPTVAGSWPRDDVKQVAEAMLAGRVVPVLGAEVGELARRLFERFELPAGESAELTRVAQYVTLMRGAGPLYDELHEQLKATTAPTSIHRFFAAMPTLLRERGAPHQLVVTTSYDLGLEQAFLDAGEQFDVVSYLASGPHRGKFCHLAPDGTARVIDVPNRYATELALERRTVILRLHGGVDRADDRAWESFVVTEDDYIGYMAHSDIAKAIPVSLAAQLRRSHFLFLGYGMRDWNLRVVLNRLWGTETVDYRSWAVASDAGPMERAFWRGRDIELLEMPVEQYVDVLAQHTGVAAEALQ